MEKILPDTQRLVSLRDEGMTHKQIADWLEAKQGIKVSVNTVSSALSRAGLTKVRPRYENHLPWTVQSRHATHYAARMLRLMGRRDFGGVLTDAETKRLDSWLAKLEGEHAVVVYLPDSDEGFYYVDGEPNEDGIPVMRTPAGR